MRSEKSSAVDLEQTLYMLQLTQAFWVYFTFNWNLNTSTCWIPIFRFH